LTRFPRHGDNFATRAIPPDLRDKSPDQIASGGTHAALAAWAAKWGSRWPSRGGADGAP